MYSGMVGAVVSKVSGLMTLALCADRLEPISSLLKSATPHIRLTASVAVVRYDQPANYSTFQLEGRLQVVRVIVRVIIPEK